MVMTDKDNILIDDFFEGRNDLAEIFKQAAQQQIEDDGFTERVMQNLPEKAVSVRRLSRLWSLFCILVGIGLFFAFGGWQVLQGLFYGGLRMLLGWLEVFAMTAPTNEINTAPSISGSGACVFSTGLRKSTTAVT